MPLTESLDDFLETLVEKYREFLRNNDICFDERTKKYHSKAINRWLKYHMDVYELKKDYDEERSPSIKEASSSTRIE